MSTIAPLTVGAGIEEVLAQGRIAGPDGVPHPVAVRFSYQPGSGVVASVIPADEPLNSRSRTRSGRLICGRCCAPNKRGTTTSKTAR